MRRHNLPNDFEQIKIFFAGQQLQVDQNKTLEEFGIEDGSTIMLVIVVCNRNTCVCTRAERGMMGMGAKYDVHLIPKQVV